MILEIEKRLFIIENKSHPLVGKREEENKPYIETVTCKLYNGKVYREIRRTK
jgi:hypothetical protein